MSHGTFHTVCDEYLQWFLVIRGRLYYNCNIPFSTGLRSVPRCIVEGPHGPHPHREGDERGGVREQEEGRRSEDSRPGKRTRGGRFPGGYLRVAASPSASLPREDHGPPVRGTRGPLQRPAEPPLLDAPSFAHPHPLLPRQEALPVMLRTEEKVPVTSDQGPRNASSQRATYTPVVIRSVIWLDSTPILSENALEVDRSLSFPTSREDCRLFRVPRMQHAFTDIRVFSGIRTQALRQSIDISGWNNLALMERRRFFLKNGLRVLKATQNSLESNTKGRVSITSYQSFNHVAWKRALSGQLGKIKSQQHLASDDSLNGIIQMSKIYQREPPVDGTTNETSRTLGDLQILR
ncbi:hypothetical protein TNCV_3912831 [Trichonephila clavipes]|nr:hypothetical protein TNCV_3912831 [Trichonephila clavipes]